MWVQIIERCSARCFYATATSFLPKMSSIPVGKSIMHKTAMGMIVKLLCV